MTVTQPAVTGPFSCFDAFRGGPGRRALEVDLSQDDDDDDSGVGYLASAVTDRTGAGSAGCPWLLRTSPWQRINVTLIDFSESATRGGSSSETFGYNIVLGEPRDTDQVDGRHHRLNRNDVEQPRPPAADDVNYEDPSFPPSHHTDANGRKLQELHLRTFCHKYAVVRERQPTSSRETVVCGDKARRKVVYLSAGNEIEVELIRTTATDAGDENETTKQRAVFLLQYDSQYSALEIYCDYSFLGEFFG